ncbi:MAG: DJ-1/PfpI family protein [Pseudomonadota bacterium]
MRIAVLAFDGFNELDSLIALGILNRVKQPDWQVALVCPSEKVRSMNGITVEAQAPLAFAHSADAVLIGSGMQTRNIVKDDALMAQLDFDPSRQLLGAQCSGALILAKLGLLNGVPACTDLTTKPWVQEAGITVLNQPFTAKGNVATAGGCLSAPYLAAWVIARLASVEAAQEAMYYFAPVGEKEEYVARAMGHIAPTLVASAETL